MNSHYGRFSGSQFDLDHKLGHQDEVVLLVRCTVSEKTIRTARQGSTREISVLKADEVVVLNAEPISLELPDLGTAVKTVTPIYVIEEESASTSRTTDVIAPDAMESEQARALASWKPEILELSTPETTPIPAYRTPVKLEAENKTDVEEDDVEEEVDELAESRFRRFKPKDKSLASFLSSVE